MASYRLGLASFHTVQKPLRVSLIYVESKLLQVHKTAKELLGFNSCALA